MTDEPRPQPEYGQYATPQEQAKAVAKSLPTPAISTPPATSTPHRGAPHLGPPHLGAPHLGRPHLGALPKRQLTGQRNSPAATRRPDRLITLMMLAVGLGYALSQIPGNLSLAQVFDQLYKQMGVGSYEVTSATATIGVALIIAQLAVWVLTALWAFRRIRAGRASWWIPVVGAVVSVAVSSALMAVLLMADPAFTTYLSTKGV